MALVNHAKREINAKLVFYGAGHAGKGTNLQYIYRKLKPEHRGKLKAMNVQQDRLLFFDFTPPGQGKVGEYNVRFHVYSLVGEVTNSAAWKMVLKGADGVIFVADSAPARMQENRDSLRKLQNILGAFGRKPSALPGVLQCNKRDLPTATPLEEMGRVLNPGGFAVQPAVAQKGEGVLDSLFSVVKSVLKELRESGLELEKESVQLAGLTAMASREDGTAGVEPASQTVEGEIPPVAAAGLERAEVPPPPSAGFPEAGGGDATIEPAGKPELLPDGRLRLPLTVRFGGREKRVAVTVAVSLELADGE
jgi:uncharacterized protein